MPSLEQRVKRIEEFLIQDGRFQEVADGEEEYLPPGPVRDMNKTPFTNIPLAPSGPNRTVEKAERNKAAQRALPSVGGDDLDKRVLALAVKLCESEGVPASGGYFHNAVAKIMADIQAR